MTFFELTHPKYRSDKEYNHYNSISHEREYMMPGMDCEAKCGRWSSSTKLVMELPEVIRGQRILQRAHYQFLSRDQWVELQTAVAQTLQVEKDKIRPGTELGIPRVIVTGPLVSDFLFAEGTNLFVRDTVVEVLARIGATGVRPVKAIVDVKRRKGQPVEEVPDLWYLDVTGWAWREGVSEHDRLICNYCGRTRYPDAEYVIDEDRSSHTDFFHIEKNPSMIFVSERVCEAFTAHGLKNFCCVVPEIHRFPWEK